MPVYEFECKHCKNLFEEQRKITDGSKFTVCTECGRTAEKVISQTSFIIHGFAAINGYAKGNVTR